MSIELANAGRNCPAKFAAVCGLLLLVHNLGAQLHSFEEGGQLEPRQLFDSAGGAQGAGRLGLRYRIFRKDSLNEFVKVSPDTVFQSGDEIRLELEANRSGYVYVLQEEGMGKWVVLFPQPGIHKDSYYLKPGKSRLFPAEGGLVFDANPGTETLLVALVNDSVASADNVAAAIAMVKSVQGAEPKTTARPEPREGVLQSRDLIVQTVGSAGSNRQDGDKAVYAVTTTESARPAILVRVRLVHVAISPDAGIDRPTQGK